MPEPIAPGPSSERPLPAKVGRYEVVRLVGEGAMGRVLLAHDPVLDRDVAIKHLRGDLKIPRDVRKGLLTRMQHEARAAARVAHPNLVVLHDMGEDEAVGLYLVFEYIEGPTLKQRIHDDGRLPAAEAARLARELGGALSLAHEAGILHRDVKPENIMLARTGGKIADFGIARIPDSTLTHQGGLMGTPAYSAPETFRPGKFSPASDQFSLAASLYEAISGQRAFPGEDAVSVAARIANEPPARFAPAIGLLPAVDEVLGRALDRHPEARFPSCEAFGEALAQALTLPAAGALARAELPSAPLMPPGQAGTALAQGASARPPRKMGQVVLGAIMVVGTAALIVHAEILSSERDADLSRAPHGAASAQTVGTATTHPLRPSATARPTSAFAPLPPRPVRPHPEASAEIRRGPALAEVVPPDTSPAAKPDGGAPASPIRPPTAPP